MIKIVVKILCFGFLFINLWQVAEAQNAVDLPKETVAEKERSAVFEIEKIIREIIKASFPELSDAKISVKIFDSSSDFFRSRFSINHLLTFRRMRYAILVNPKVFERGAPAEGIRAIVAHELAHTVFFRQRNRFKLFGLIALESASYRAKFERGADLQAIKRGYGAGLKIYREWLYRNIPGEKIRAKKRDYFSPEEIDLIIQKTEKNSSLFNYWMKYVPRNLSEIEQKTEKQ